MIFAGSPQAKGRIERLWNTFQDRLVAELRLAGITDIAGANAFLPGYLERHNVRFAVPAQDPSPAWRALPAGVAVDDVCCLKYARHVAGDNTVTHEGAVVQLPPGMRGSYAHLRVEVRHHLDGSISVHLPGGKQLARSAPGAAMRFRPKGQTRAPVGGVQPTRATSTAATRGGSGGQVSSVPNCTCRGPSSPDGQSLGSVSGQDLGSATSYGGILADARSAVKGR